MSFKGLRALPSLRIGWLASRDRALLERLERRKHHTSICNAGPREHLATIALGAADRIKARNRAIIAANLPIFDAFFAAWPQHFAWAHPQGGCVCFPRLLTGEPTSAFCRRLVETVGVVLLPADIYHSQLADVPIDRFRSGVGRRGPNWRWRPLTGCLRAERLGTRSAPQRAAPLQAVERLLPVRELIRGAPASDQPVPVRTRLGQPRNPRLGVDPGISRAVATSLVVALNRPVDGPGVGWYWTRPARLFGAATSLAGHPTSRPRVRMLLGDANRALSGDRAHSAVGGSRSSGRERRVRMAERPGDAALAATGFGGLLRGCRERGLLSQERLAERSGLSARTIRDLEAGRVRRPRGASVRLLADALRLEGALRAAFEAAARDGNLAVWAGLPPGGALCQLPPDVADFTGRAAQVALVQQLLADAAPGRTPPAVVVSAVAGKAGVGKTTLAVHVAHQLRSRFPDGQLYANLRGAGPQPLDPGEVLSRFLRALGVDGAAIPADLGERAALYRAWLANRRVLVVLDDAADEAQVRPLLPGTAGCGVLATSRARLSGLEGARLLDLEVLPPGQAVELLGRIAGAERVAAEPQAATTIAAACGGLPLAVRIAGAKLARRPHWSLARLASLLADERRRLDQLAVGDLEVRASVALSYQALTSEQQRMFRFLGLLGVADFAVWVPAALLDITWEQAEGLVDRLVQAQLLEVAARDPTGQVRYRFHDLLRLYARERAAAEDLPQQRQAGLARALGGWLALAEQADQRLPSSLFGAFHGDAPRWRPSATAVEALMADPLAWLEAERAALAAAVDQAAAEGLDELAWDLAGSLVNFLDLRGYLDDWQRTHQAALAAARRDGNRSGEASLLRGLGYLSLQRNRMDTTMACNTRALSIYRRLGDRRGQAHALEGLGVVHRLQGRHAAATTCLEQAITMLVEVGDRHGEAWTRFQLAVLHAEQGELVKARAELEQALGVFQEFGERRGEAWTQRRLGLVHAAQGDLDRATACLERALAGLRQLRDRAALAQTLRSLGEVSLRRGQQETASGLFQECLAVARELDDPFVEAGALGGLGDLHHLQGNRHEAVRCLERSAALWRKLDMPLELALTLQRLGEVYLDAGSPAAGESACREAVKLLQRIGHPEAEQAASRLDHLVGAESSSTSCDLGIFVDQPAQSIDPHDPHVRRRSGRGGRP